MTDPVNIEQRRPIWIALSGFYLDTELQDSDFRQIAFTILDSPYSFDEVKSINKYEVFPILQSNLLSPAGVWTGFDETWLLEKITLRLNNKTKLNDIGVELSYQTFKWMCKKYWKKLEKIYNDIKINPDTFIVTCRAAFINHLLLFQFDQATLPLYQKLEQIALDYKQKGQLRPFYEHLQEGQYYINFWTAYFLIEKFELTGTEKLIGLNDNEFIVEHCYRLIENHFQSLKDKEQINNCSFWLESKKATYNRGFALAGGDEYILSYTNLPADRQVLFSFSPGATFTLTYAKASVSKTFSFLFILVVNYSTGFCSRARRSLLPRQRKALPLGEITHYAHCDFNN